MQKIVNNSKILFCQSMADLKLEVHNGETYSAKWHKLGLFWDY
jgi:hypothetical protein